MTSIRYHYCDWCEEATEQFTRDHVDCVEVICGRCGRIVDRAWKEDDELWVPEEGAEA